VSVMNEDEAEADAAIALAPCRNSGSGLGFRVYSRPAEARPQGLAFGVHESRFRGGGVGLWGLGVKVLGIRFQVSGQGFGV